MGVLGVKRLDDFGRRIRVIGVILCVSFVLKITMIMKGEDPRAVGGRGMTSAVE